MIKVDASNVDVAIATRAMLTDIASVLAEFTFKATNEFDLQAMVFNVLCKRAWTSSREVSSDSKANRYDLVVKRDGVVIVLELKVSGTAPAVERQAQRYAMTEGVHGVAVVTTSQRLARQLMSPGDGGQEPLHELGGKPFGVIALRAL
jgi:hypothetical protein